PRPRIVSLVFPVPTTHPPPRESPEHRAHTKEIERDLMRLEVVKQLQAETTPTTTTKREGEGAPPLVKKYTVSRPYAATPPGPHSLSAYTLRGPGKFAVPPLVFTTQDKRESVLILHVGDGLCGHEGVVHGGLLATVLDEALGRTALLNLPTNIGVTATLSLKYKKPTFANQFLVIRTELTEQRGRKAWVRGKVEDLDGQTLVEAEALFVEPRMAQFLSSSSVREALK
ncbi:Thioesterase/thiol ester dehydrase-isomerase, partial [Rhodotorula sp. JG-1b]